MDNQITPQAPVIPTANQGPVTVNPMNAQPKKSIMPIVIASVIAVFAVVAIIGAGAYFVLNKKAVNSSTGATGATVDKEVSTALTKIAVDSGEQVNKLSINEITSSLTNPFEKVFNNTTSKGGSTKMTLSVDTKGDFSGTSVSYDGVFETKSNTSEKKEAVAWNSNVLVSNGSIKVEVKDLDIQTIFADGKLYLKGKNLPQELYTFSAQSYPTLDLKNKIEDKWFVTDIKDLYKKNSTIDFEKELSDSKNKDKAELIKAFYVKITAESKNYNLFKNSKNLGKETVAGVTTIRYQTEPNYDEISKYLKYASDEFIKLDKEMASKNGTKPTMTKSNYYTEIDDAIAQVQKSVRFNSVEIYVGESDGNIYKYSVDFDVLNVSKAITNKDGGDLNFKHSFEITAKDKAVSIEVPTGASDLQKTIDEINAKMKPATTTKPSSTTRI